MPPSELNHFENIPFKLGAFSRDRTGDLILTMDALYLLSYEGILSACQRSITQSQLIINNNKLTINVDVQVHTATTRRLFSL